MKIRFDHIALRTGDIESIKEFFVDVIGLEVGNRPSFPFPGYWLYADVKSNAIVHIMGKTDEQVSADLDKLKPGIFDHIAFSSDDYYGIMARIRNHHLPYTEKKIPGTTTTQVFVYAPENLRVEIDFCN